MYEKKYLTSTLQRQVYFHAEQLPPVDPFFLHRKQISELFSLEDLHNRGSGQQYPVYGKCI